MVFFRVKSPRFHSCTSRCPNLGRPVSLKPARETISHKPKTFPPPARFVAAQCPPFQLEAGHDHFEERKRLHSDLQSRNPWNEATEGSWSSWEPLEQDNTDPGSKPRCSKTSHLLLLHEPAQELKSPYSSETRNESTLSRRPDETEVSALMDEPAA